MSQLIQNTIWTFNFVLILKNLLTSKFYESERILLRFMCPNKLQICKKIDWLKSNV